MGQESPRCDSTASRELPLDIRIPFGYGWLSGGLRWIARVVAPVVVGSIPITHPIFLRP